MLKNEDIFNVVTGIITAGHNLYFGCRDSAIYKFKRRNVDLVYWVIKTISINKVTT